MPLCTKSLAISANCVVGAAYGLQFFLAPGFTIEQNFKVVPDKYHKFMGRFTGGLVERVASHLFVASHPAAPLRHVHAHTLQAHEVRRRSDRVAGLFRFHGVP